MAHCFHELSLSEVMLFVQCYPLGAFYQHRSSLVLRVGRQNCPFVGCSNRVWVTVLLGSWGDWPCFFTYSLIAVIVLISHEVDRYFISQHFITKSMSNCTHQSAGCQKGRPIKAGRLYYMKLLLITQSQEQKTNRQKYRQTDRHICLS